MKINHALIMAAGRGMRMRPLTDKIPKAMAPFGESTLIAEGIKKIKREIKNVHITVGYKGAMLASHVIESDVSSVINTQGKGNSWWIYNTLISKIDEPVLVLTCDNIVDINFKDYLDEYNKINKVAMIIPVRPIMDIEGDFIHLDKHRNIMSLSRKIKSEIYCSGIQILNPFRVCSETKRSNSFSGVWRQLIHNKQLYCSQSIPEKWLSIDDLGQLRNLNKT